MRRERHDEPVADDVLGSYLDHELERSRRAAVEAHIAANPSAARFVTESDRVRAGLHRLFDRELTRPLTPAQEALTRQLEQRLRRGGRVRAYRKALAVAATVVAMAGAGALGWSYLAPDRPGEALYALFNPDDDPARPSDGDGHPGIALAVLDGQQASSEEALSGDTERPTGAPDFADFGFGLIGARLLVRDAGESMQLIYESGEGARVELFFSPVDESSRRSLTLMEEGPLSLLFWHNAGHSYSLIGEVDRDTLLEMGKVVNGRWTIDLPGTEGGVGNGGSSDGERGAPDERKDEGEAGDTKT